MLLPDVDDELLKAGKIAPGAVGSLASPLRLDCAGTFPRIDVSTPEAVKTSMLNAKSLRWAPTGAALLTVNKILDTLGIRETVKAKHNLPGTVALGPGEYEINLYPQSEILDNKELRNLAQLYPRSRFPR